MVTTLYPNDTSEFTMDKQAHFIGSYGLYFMFKHKDFSELDSFKYTLYCGLAKELIIDDKVSKYDLGYNLLGIGVAYGVDKLWDKIFKNKQKPFNLSISIQKY